MIDEAEKGPCVRIKGCDTLQGCGPMELLYLLVTTSVHPLLCAPNAKVSLALHRSPTPLKNMFFTPCGARLHIPSAMAWAMASESFFGVDTRFRKIYYLRSVKHFKWLASHT